MPRLNRHHARFSSPFPHHIDDKRDGADESSPQRRQLQARQDDLSPDLDPDAIITEVVQTISVLQVLDPDGATVHITTLQPEPTGGADVLDPDVVPDVVVSTPDVVVPLPTPEPQLPDFESPVPTLPAETTPAESYAPMTSSPLSSPPPYPTFVGAWNSTSAFNSSSLFTNSSLSVTVPLTNSTTFALTAFTNSTTFATSTATPDATSTLDPGAFVGGVGNPGGAAGSGGDATPTDVVTGSGGGDGGSGGGGGGPGPTATTSTVVGGVFGGIAGAALLIFAALFILRWRKRGAAAVALLGGEKDRGSGGRGLLTEGGPAGGGPPSTIGPNRRSTMTERSFLPFAVPSALAALTGTAAPNKLGGEETAERGFYRVAGRKLAPALLTGGDGYTDPTDPNGSRDPFRAAAANNNSNYSTGSAADLLPTLRESNFSTATTFQVRDSHAFFAPGGAAALADAAAAAEQQQRSTPRPSLPPIRSTGGALDSPRLLALGSPMRPDSGVPMIRASPARTPVTEHMPSSPGGLSVPGSNNGGGGGGMSWGGGPAGGPLSSSPFLPQSPFFAGERPVSHVPEHGNVGGSMLPPLSPLDPPPPLALKMPFGRDRNSRPDAPPRTWSLNSQDGSRTSRGSGSGSRFTEEI